MGGYEMRLNDFFAYSDGAAAGPDTGFPLSVPYPSMSKHSALSEKGTIGQARRLG